jgi:hypothetical protein
MRRSLFALEWREQVPTAYAFLQRMIDLGTASEFTPRECLLNTECTTSRRFPSLFAIHNDLEPFTPTPPNGILNSGIVLRK